MDNDFLALINTNTHKRELSRVNNCNEYSARYGLTLSDADAEKLLALRDDDLQEKGRVEWDGGILDKLIYAFADSVHISEDNYFDTLASLQSMFYDFKNESLDLMDDDDLIAAMRKAYDRSEGSLDYVAETAMAERCREVRFEGYNDDDDMDEDHIEDGDDLL